jgi:thiol-disulfide isomerase/thioredoxin
MLDKLIDARVLAPEDDGRGYRLTSSYEEKVESEKQEIEDEESLLDTLEPTLGKETAVAVASYEEQARSFTAEMKALESVFSDTSQEDLIQTASVMLHLRYDPPSNSGTPEPLLLVSPDQLQILLQIHSKAVVYVWRDDCPPCDEMKGVLENAFSEPPTGISLFSVYGTESPELLEERYDVVAGPTTLFVVNGSVDSRLHGAHYEEVVHTQLEILQSL